MLKIERDPWVVTGWDIRQYSFCPVIPWLRSNYGIEEPATYSMELGKDVSKEDMESLANELRLPKPWLFEVLIENYELGITGKVDLLGGSKWFVVVEVKRSIADVDAVFQLKRYVDYYKSLGIDVKGVLATPKLTAQAQKLLVSYGLTHIPVKSLIK